AQMTAHVVSRPYRAPEAVMCAGNYSQVHPLLLPRHFHSSALPLLLALYLLKLRRRPLRVVSTLFWPRASEDAQVNVPLRWLRPSWLLLLHLLALAKEAEVNFSLSDIQAICRQVPVYCDFAPRGKGTMVDLHRIGGTTMLLKHLLQIGLLDGSCLTVTGKTLEENLLDAAAFPVGNNLVAEQGKPWKEYADLQVCYGNVAPDGIVFKVSSIENAVFEGRAICFESGRAVSEAAVSGKIQPGHMVVLRGLGPVGAGMPEVHVATSALSVPELKGRVALISDTRVSGVSSGAIGVHCSPEAALGGPIGKLIDGDIIRFDLHKGYIHADVCFEERKPFQSPTNHPRGYLADFARLVSQAHEGCVSF
ncbi:MAG: dihydroxy-acid dehydratase, partial [Pirellula sp.]